MYLVKDAEDGITGNTKYDGLPTIAEAVETLKAQVAQDKPLDLPAEFRGLSMGEDGAIIHASTKVNMCYTKHSLSQMVSRIKPADVVGMAGYLAACPPDLRALNFNYWHDEFYGEQVHNPTSNEVVLRLVRRNNELLARAVVSKQYVPIDDLPIVNVLNEIMPKDGRARFVRGDVKSWYSMFWPDKNVALPNSKDEIVVGVRVINSETGSSGAYVVPVFYSRNTGGCMILWGSRSRKTIGIRHVGEAHRIISKAFKSAAEYVETGTAALRAASGDYPAGFSTRQEMAVAIAKYLEIPVETVIGALETCNDELPSRLNIAAALSAEARGMHIAKAEDLEVAAGKLISVPWGTLARYKQHDE